LWKSVRTALIVSVSCVLIGYPIAYFLAFVAGGRRYVLLLLIIVPFWTSFLLRVLAWKVILGSNGVINSFLFSTGLRDEGNPLSQLLYSQFTVMLVLAYVWIPFVVFPIFVSLDAIDTRLLAAAQDLGASRWQAFLRVTLPLSLPGVAAGFAFVFIPTIGEFVTPALVGGTEGFLYGNAIADSFGMNFDLQTGSVLALALLAVVVVATVAFARVLTVRQVAAG
jgi:spermidine/putrescine transport system permease protein